MRLAGFIGTIRAGKQAGRAAGSCSGAGGCPGGIELLKKWLYGPIFPVGQHQDGLPEGGLLIQLHQMMAQNLSPRLVFSGNRLLVQLGIKRSGLLSCLD